MDDVENVSVHGGVSRVYIESMLTYTSRAAIMDIALFYYFFIPYFGTMMDVRCRHP